MLVRISLVVLVSLVVIVVSDSVDSKTNAEESDASFMELVRDTRGANKKCGGIKCKKSEKCDRKPKCVPNKAQNEEDKKDNPDCKCEDQNDGNASEGDTPDEGDAAEKPEVCLKNCVDQTKGDIDLALSSQTQASPFAGKSLKAIVANAPDQIETLKTLLTGGIEGFTECINKCGECGTILSGFIENLGKESTTILGKVQTFLRDVNSGDIINDLVATAT